MTNQNRLIKRLAIALLMLGFASAICAGVALVLLGGDLATLAQTAYIRVSLSFREDDLNRAAGFNDAPVRFTVNSGDTPRIIARRLLSENLILDEDLFVDYVRATGLDIELEAGTYFPNETQTIPELALMFTDSASSYIPFRILEGWRIEEVAETIDSSAYFGFSGADFLALVDEGAEVDPAFANFVGLPEGASLEGFLYPDSYQLPPDVTPERLRTILTQQFVERVGPQLKQDAEEQGLTLFEAVTIASIVEKEALHDDEHVLIASVYRNRLDIDMKLDADPTVQYGINGARGRWWPPITVADYRGVISEYNTYLNTGLPPGPIASPGISAIRGAIYPVESSYFFFRASCTGSGYHDFATTYDEHIANGC